MTRRRRSRTAFVALVAYLALAVLLLHRTWSDPADRIVAKGDYESFIWFIKWVHFALVDGHNPFITNWLNYPGGVNLMWNPASTLPGLLAAPVTHVFGPIVALNVWATLGFAVSAWTAFLACRRYVRRRGAAFCAGLLYGFSPYMVAHGYGHLNLILVFIPPLVLLTLDEILVRRRFNPYLSGGLLGLLAGCQLLTWTEVLATTALCAVVGVGVLAVVNRSELKDYVKLHAHHVARAALAAIGVFAVIAAWPLYEMFYGPQVPHETLHANGVYVNDLLNFVIPTEVQLFTADRGLEVTRRFTGNAAEWNGYVGLPLLLLLTYQAVRAWRDKTVRVFALTGLAIAILSTDPTVHYQGEAASLLSELPLVKHLLPARLMVIGYLCLGIVLARFIDETWNRPARARWVAMGAVVVSFVALLPKPYPSVDLGVPAFFRGDDVRRIPEGSAALVAPVPAPYWPPDAEVWQAVSHMRFRLAAEVYSFVPDPNSGKALSFAPATAITTGMLEVQQGKQPEVTPSLRMHAVNEIREWGIRTVIVGPMPYQGAMVAYFRNLLGREPELRSGVYVWWDVTA